VTWVKICGTTNVEDALLAVEAGADALGFVFCAQSPRHVTPEQVREIVRELPVRVETVGVFVNEAGDRMEAVAEMAGLTAMQLHGDEYRDHGWPFTARKIFVTIPARELGEDWRKTLPPNLGGVLVDSSTAQQRGGTGKTFDWAEARSSLVALGQKLPIVVAGGLTPENVAEAISILKPWGVDVSSGVEAHPGKKDPEKVRAFVTAVRGVEQRQ
jgi:phosphoribosylanthranilate isomerase